MSRRLPSLNALRALEAALRHRSFVRASEELGVTPAAVSQQIKQLEEYLGSVLFNRGKGVEPSESALEALPQLSEAFDRLEGVVNRLRQGSGGALVVSTPPAFAARWLIPRLDDFHARHPEVELRLLATRRLVDFALEDVDVAIRFGTGPYPGLHAERLMPEAIVAVAAPDLAATLSTPADLLHCSLLEDEWHAGNMVFPDWETWLASFGVSVAGAELKRRRFGDANLAIGAAIAGLGVGLAWQSLVADEVRAGRLVRLFDSTLPTSRSYQLVIPLNRMEYPKVVAFRQWLSEMVAQEVKG